MGFDYWIRHFVPDIATEINGELLEIGSNSRAPSCVVKTGVGCAGAAAFIARCPDRWGKFLSVIAAHERVTLGRFGFTPSWVGCPALDTFGNSVVGPAHYPA